MLNVRDLIDGETDVDTGEHGPPKLQVLTSALRLFVMSYSSRIVALLPV